MEWFKSIIDRELTAKGTTPIRAATAAGLNRDAIRSVMRGREPRLTHAKKIAEALGLEFYVGPPRPRKSGTTPPLCQTARRAEVSRRGLVPVEDADLARLLALLADDWESADERRRGAIEYALREQLGLRGGGSARRAVRWLGWEVIDGADAAGEGDG